MILGLFFIDRLGYAFLSRFFLGLELETFLPPFVGWYTFFVIRTTTLAPTRHALVGRDCVVLPAPS